MPGPNEAYTVDYANKTTKVEKDFEVCIAEDSSAKLADGASVSD